MAAGSIPAPGTRLGPCLDPCGHTDCAASRQMAQALCGLCRQAIGYETNFFMQDRPEHARCVYDQQDKTGGET